MALSCPHCGRELPDQAILCLRCGTFLHDAAQSAALAERPWEYCEVVYTVEPRGSSRDFWFTKTYYFNVVFWAKGSGPQGSFQTTKGKTFPGRTTTHTDAVIPAWAAPQADNAEDGEAVDEIVAYLLKQGWEALPNKGTRWYSYRFRRSVRSGALVDGPDSPGASR